MAEEQTLQAEGGALGSLLRRGWSMIVLGAVIGLAGGVLVTLHEKKQYTAAASVLVTPTGAEDSTTLAKARTTGTINLDTEARLVRSTDVAEQVRKLDPSTNSVTFSRLLSGLSVTVPANTQILTIHYVSRSPTLAAQRANDFASAYLIQRQGDAQAKLDGQIKNTQAELTNATARLQSVAATLGRLPATSAQRNFAQAQRALIVGQISKLTSIMTELLTTAVTPGKVLTKATAPTQPFKPVPALNLASGVALGLLIGLLAAWLRFMIRRRLKTPNDVLARLHLPVLQTIPPSGGTGIVPNTSSAYQSYRRLSNVLSASLPDPGVVLVTGGCTPRAVNAVAGNLARVLAESGVPTAMRRDEHQELSGQSPTNVLAAKIVDLPANSIRDRRRIDAIRGESLLIVSAPDGQRTAEAQSMALACDAAIIVVEARAKAEASERLLRELDAVGAAVLGAVLVPSGRWWMRRNAGLTRRAVAEAPEHIGGAGTSEPSATERATIQP